MAFPYEVSASIIRFLQPGDRLAFVAYRAEDPQVPINALDKMREAQIKRAAVLLPLVWGRTVRTLPWQQPVVFLKRNSARALQRPSAVDAVATSARCPAHP